MIKLLFIRGGFAWSSYNYNVIPFKTIRSLLFHRTRYHTEAWVKNLFGNIVLFIPLGLFLPALNRRLLQPGSFIMLIVLILLVVELTQMFTKVGSFDVDDIILNTFGAAIGLALVKASIKLISKRSDSGQK